MHTTGTLIPHTSIRRVNADGVTIFYREAGPALAASHSRTFRRR